MKMVFGFGRNVMLYALYPCCFQFKEGYGARINILYKEEDKFLIRDLNRAECGKISW
jgi:hypothetical protein